MEEKNKVSVFIGDFLTEKDFDDYLEENFTEDGDIYSELMKDLKVDFIDNQFQEVLFKKDKLEISDLKDFSYSENFGKFIDQNLSQYNSLILLYNFKVVNTPIKIKVLGVYDYR